LLRLIYAYFVFINLICLFAEGETYTQRKLFPFLCFLFVACDYVFIFLIRINLKLRIQVLRTKTKKDIVQSFEFS